MRRILTGIVLLAVAGCGNLTCSQAKKDAIKHNNKGVEALKAKTYSIAQKEFETAINLDPDYHEAAYHLGEAYANENHWDKAAEAYTKAVKAKPDNPQYHYKLAKAYFEAEKWDLAKQEFEKALSLNNKQFKAHYYLGKIHALQDRPKEAAQSWTEAARLNASFGKPLYDLGKLYYQWEMYDLCISVLEQGAQHVLDPEDKTNVYHMLGMAYHATKNLDKAIDAYEKAIRTKSDNVDARLMLGNAYADKGDKANAKKNLDEFIKLGGGGNAFLIQSAHERLLRMAAGQ